MPTHQIVALGISRRRKGGKSSASLTVRDNLHARRKRRATDRDAFDADLEYVFTLPDPRRAN